MRRKTPEAQGLQLTKREGVLRQDLTEARDAGGVSSCDGRAEAAAAI